MTDSKTIRAKFNEAAAPILARLRELHEEGEAQVAAAGGATPQTAQRRAWELAASRERDGLRRELGHAEARAAEALAGWLDGSRAALAAARGTPVGTDQERMVRLLEADQLSRTTAAEDLLAQARRALTHGDAVAADTRLRAAKLASGGKPVRGIDPITAEVEAALDASVPHRKAAVEAHRADRAAFADAAIERMKAAQLASLLVGDRPSAARASIAAKMAAYEQAAASGKQYEEEVVLERVGADGPTI